MNLFVHISTPSTQNSGPVPERERERERMRERDHIPTSSVLPTNKQKKPYRRNGMHLNVQQRKHLSICS